MQCYWNETEKWTSYIFRSIFLLWIENWDKIINRKGYEFVDNGYVSTRLKLAVADNFAILNDEDGIFAYIKVSNINGVNINAISSIN